MTVDAILQKCMSKRFIACKRCGYFTRSLGCERRLGRTLVDVWCAVHKQRAVVSVSDNTVEDRAFYWIWTDASKEGTP